jgi:hypothetical protein
VFDPDDIARGMGYGDLCALLTRAEFTVRDGVLWIKATLSTPGDTAGQAAPVSSAANTRAPAVASKINASEFLPLLAGTRATFALRLAESLVNRMVANGITLWRTRTGNVPALPAGMDLDVGQLALRFENGWMIVEGSGALSKQQQS